MIVDARTHEEISTALALGGFVILQPQSPSPFPEVLPDGIYSGISRDSIELGTRVWRALEIENPAVSPYIDLPVWA